MMFESMYMPNVEALTKSPGFMAPQKGQSGGDDGFSNVMKRQVDTRKTMSGGHDDKSERDLARKSEPRIDRRSDKESSSAQRDVDVSSRNEAAPKDNIVREDKTSETRGDQPDGKKQREQSANKEQDGASEEKQQGGSKEQQSSSEQNGENSEKPASEQEKSVDDQIAQANDDKVEVVLNLLENGKSEDMLTLTKNISEIDANLLKKDVEAIDAIVVQTRSHEKVEEDVLTQLVQQSDIKGGKQLLATLSDREKLELTKLAKNEPEAALAALKSLSTTKAKHAQVERTIFSARTGNNLKPVQKSVVDGEKLDVLQGLVSSTVDKGETESVTSPLMRKHFLERFHNFNAASNNDSTMQTMHNPSASTLGSVIKQPLGLMSTAMTDTLSASSASQSTLQRTVPLNLPTPMGTPAWEGDLGSRLVWMVNNQVQTAQVRINPAHLGPVEIKITLQGDQASIMFNAQNMVTREAIETAIPRLRESLNENGVELKDVNVSDGGLSQQNNPERREKGFADELGQANDENDLDAEEALKNAQDVESTAYGQRGFIDDYA